jgi:hypothetical protein
MERTNNGHGKGNSNGGGVVFHSPKPKKEIIAKNIEQINHDSQPGVMTTSLRHNPPAEILEPKGQSLVNDSLDKPFSLFVSLI